MIHMKFRTTIFLALFTLISSRACAGLKVICSMYPVYDFTRAITRELADVSLLLKPGTEPHEYEPSPQDIMALHDADVFVFTGSNMEQWAGKISDLLGDTVIVDASENIPLSGNDPHIWLDLSLAQRMVMNILAGLVKADPDNSGTYTHNAEEYCSELGALDAEFTAMKKDRALVFAGEFSCGYFVRRYGFEYVSAYDGENEPSVRRMSEVIRYIHEHRTRYIFADYGAVSQVTRAISDETGARILTFGTGHNVPSDDVMFLQIMRENFRNITEAMND